MPRALRAVPAILLLAGVTACSFHSRDSAAEVQDAVRAYFEAVNRADPTAIMNQYSRNPEATSVFEGDLVRGWEQIRKETDKMAGTAGDEKWAPGTMEVIFMGEDHALVVAPVNITLHSAVGNEELQGASTLVMERVDGRWMILHEHHSIKTSDSEDDYDSSRG
jgi:uncharacterized protein (TIGR02246 family)